MSFIRIFSIQFLIFFFPITLIFSSFLNFFFSISKSDHDHQLLWANQINERQATTSTPTVQTKSKKNANFHHIWWQTSVWQRFWVIYWKKTWWMLPIKMISYYPLHVMFSKRNSQIQSESQIIMDPMAIHRYDYWTSSAMKFVIWKFTKKCKFRMRPRTIDLLATFFRNFFSLWCLISKWPWFGLWIILSFLICFRLNESNDDKKKIMFVLFHPSVDWNSCYLSNTLLSVTNCKAECSRKYRGDIPKGNRKIGNSNSLTKKEERKKVNFCSFFEIIMGNYKTGRSFMTQQQTFSFIAHIFSTKIFCSFFTAHHKVIHLWAIHFWGNLWNAIER